MRLNKAKIGVNYQVTEFQDCFIACKLMSMGILPGTIVKVLRKSVLGSTFYIEYNQQFIAIRANEAQAISIN
ncbi:MAG: ferrous iron transport protein A [Chitinophagales bacterium]|nr:ferrous iron transport protein A [Chitinophagales bacterium]